MATKYTDASGQVSLTAGKGDMLYGLPIKGHSAFPSYPSASNRNDIDT